MKKKSNKIIIILAIAIVAAAGVLTVGILKNGGVVLGDNGNTETLGTSRYIIQNTTVPTTVQNTEAWVDFDKFASDLATATETNTETLPSTDVSVQSMTSIVYVYVETSYVTQQEQTTEETTVVEGLDNGIVEYKYSIDPSTGTASLDEYLGDTEATVWIPDTVGGYKVTKIGENCFREKNVKSVCIKNNITSIGNNAFRDCTELTEVVFMSGSDLELVGHSAFRGCTALKTINLPATVKIDTYAFGECESLEKLTLKSGTESIGDFCFSRCSALKEMTIPKTVEYIGTQALPPRDIAPNLTVICVEGSAADDAAKKYGIPTDFIE